MRSKKQSTEHQILKSLKLI
ncbi:hypothetical protein pdam_00018605 [Pocillopora damicornis]|uniref:Uncharacterized protein n=1 Tax=Pocillopora damicornis TaxID=46731 RepID=A0A3M6U4Z8_POCDA|nr:hypothetical protein pdam_00018605 [Pocillopora damicornis]